MTKFQTAPNQKVVRVEKYPVESNENYAKISIEAMMAAAKDLDGNVFKLWCYFAKNKDIFTFALSNAAAKEQFGMTKDVYDRAIGILIQKRYLEQYDRQFYIFYEYPIKQNQAYIKELREAENPQPQTTRDEFEEIWGPMIHNF